MVDIPDRDNLESMSRIDIQKLCKDNNIKANMRTDEMINALCDLVNGKDVPRPYRSVSERGATQPPPKSRVSSVQPPPSKVTEASAKKAALQPSESNTDAESVADTPVSAPTTRRKARDIQLHLGKGRPAVAGGSGARNVTKSVSRGAGRKAKASAMLKENPIPEEDEENVPVEGKQEVQEANEAARPSSTRPISPSQTVPHSPHEQQPSQLPTPAPSLPSYSLPSAQLSALETRITLLEVPNLTSRILGLEASMAEIPVLKASLAQIPMLDAEVKRLQAVNRDIEAELGQWTKAHADLKDRTAGIEARLAELGAENGALKERVTALEEKLRDRTDVSMSSVIIHSPEPQPHKESTNAEGKVVAKAATPQPPAALADPSPSQPTLGKRQRYDTPDASSDGDDVPKKRQDAEAEAIHRVTRPQKKRARLDPDEDSVPFPFFAHDCGGPSSTSTPRQRRSDSPPGFFTVGRKAPTPLARKDGSDMEKYLRFEPDESSMGEDVSEGKAATGAIVGDVAPCTPPPRLSATPTALAAPLAPIAPSHSRTPSAHMHDPTYFSGPLPVFYTQGTELPYPLNPTTPPNAQDMLEQPAQFATPMLGEPWKYHASATVNPADVEESVVTSNPSSSTSTQPPAPPMSPTNYTFRAGGRKERNDKYNPYFTPQRGPGGRHRTGLTPTRGFSMSLKSPAKMTSVPENTVVDAAAVDDDGVERSPPQLRTLYGTELDGDTRFGDYGRDLGKFDWGKYLPR